MSYGVDVLAIGAHPDDVELFCGGIVLVLAVRGYSVGVVDLTRGEKASHGTPEERAREADAASAELGCAWRENLELPDGELAATTEHIAAVVGVLRRRRPEIVLSPWTSDRHPDHVVASEIATRAVFFAGVQRFAPDAGERFVPRQLLYYSMRHRMTPSFVVDTSSVAARKAHAIACYQSQITRRPGDDAPTLISAPGAVEAIEVRDRYYGSMIGATHGEAVRTAMTPGLVDPVRHFRDNPFAGAHAFEQVKS
jgi:bacillithiol biosynthesis deacetylase BshB1